MRTRHTSTLVRCHAEGEIGDVVTGSILPPAGATMFQKMQTMRRDHDHIRRFLLCEPRGSVARHVNILVPPTRGDCDAGVIIMEPTEWAHEAAEGAHRIYEGQAKRAVQHKCDGFDPAMKMPRESVPGNQPSLSSMRFCNGRFCGTII